MTQNVIILRELGIELSRLE